MNKQDLAKQTSEQTKLNAKEALQCIDVILDIIAESVKRGEEVSISNFGKFKLKYKAEKTAYSPFTKKLVKKAAHKVPAFKCYKRFKEVVNN